MAKRVNKRFQELLKKVDKEKKYSVDEALANIKNLASAKFDETIEVALKLNVDPRHADQMVRGSVVLPAGTGKTVRVAVIAKDDSLTAQAIVLAAMIETWAIFGILIGLLALITFPLLLLFVGVKIIGGMASKIR